MKDVLKPRWTIMLEKPEVDAFDEADFKIISKAENMFNDKYFILIIEPVNQSNAYTPDEVLNLTGALAVHEEWTNAIIVDPITVNIISDDMYSWEGSGMCFIGDMLTDLERLHFLMEYFYIETKEVIKLEDLKVREEKDGVQLPLKDHIEELFTKDFHSASYKDTDVTIWWATIIDEAGLFLVVLDEDLEDTEPAKNLYDDADYRYRYDDYPWGDYYDDYDYSDYYYRRT